MEAILSNQCLALTGMLERGLGYSLRRSKKGRFFAHRSPKGFVPPDGHWRFIVLCAELAQNGLHISDIRVSRKELAQALDEAFPVGHRALLSHRCDNLPDILSAADVLNLKMTFGL